MEVKLYRKKESIDTFMYVEIRNLKKKYADN